MDGSTTIINADPLTAARKRRVDLKAAMSEVESAAAGPAAGASWRLELQEALASLKLAFHQHVEAVESPDGLLAELVAKAPRLSPATNRLQAEHGELTASIERLIALARESAAPGELRNDALETLVAVARHRQKGADLVYEAYEVDIGEQ